MKSPNIYKYLDYRLFLKDLFLFRKKQKKIFSYRYFSAKAGFSSPNFLKLVIDGHRNLTNESVAKISKGFGFKKKERIFFENLVFMNQAKTDEEKEHYYKEISSIRGYTKVKKIEKDIYDYYSNWYNLVIREMVIFGDRKQTAVEIAEQLNPKISPKEVRKSLKLLTDLGMIRQNPNGEWERMEKALTTGAEVQSFMVANYHQKMLQLAGESINRHKPEKRDISSVTMSISSKTMTEIKRRMTAFRKEIIEIAVSDTEVDQVVQLNMQAFPLTQEPKRKK